ncbi:MAG: histidine phosphatase family protein [Anaerolineales bacterium]|nr:histidine phosphatase family protein [Anaerolineales bacterium]
MRRVLKNALVLIRHALPAIDKSVPAPAWSLSVEGRRKLKALSRYLSNYFPAKVYSSQEPKAVETAQLSIPNHMASEVITDWRLNEHHRETYK